LSKYIKGAEIRVAEAFRQDRLFVSSPDAAFLFLRGSGADPTGRSRTAFARFKGEAEKALLAVGFRRSYIFRPAYIYPSNCARSRISAAGCCE
jgi:uncharacterized protein YbjT (DUF2867 family)